MDSTSALPSNILKHILVILLFAQLPKLSAATFDSAAATGNWNDVAIWTLTDGSDDDGIPDADDVVTIKTGHVVTSNSGGAFLSLTTEAGATLIISAATDNAGLLTNNGTLDWFNGSFTGTGGITNAGTINVNVTGFGFLSPHDISGNITNNAGATINWSAGHFDGDGGGQTLTNHGTFNLVSDNPLNLVCQLHIVNKSGGNIVKGGTTTPNLNYDQNFTNESGGLVTVNSDASLTFNSPGSVTNAGSFSVNGILTNAGTLTNSSGGTISNDGYLVNNNTLNNNSGGTLNNYGDLDNNSTLNNNSGGALNNVGDLNNNSGGTLNNDGDLDNNSGGYLTNFSGAFLNNNASATLTNSAVIYNNADATLTNSGTLTSSNPGNLTNTGTLTNSSGGTLANFAFLYNNADGNLSNSGTLANHLNLNLNDNSTLNNNSGGILINEYILNNNSTLNNNSGGTLINDDAALNNNCGSTFTNGGTVNSSGTIINCATSTVTITATGMISCTDIIVGGTVVNSGEIVVGCSPGIMVIDGNFITDGSLTMELGGLTAGTGTGFHDQLQVSGAVTFGGTLTVSLFGGFAPVPTNSFTLMTYGSRTGMTTFASLDIPCPSCWSLSYGATALVLTLNSALPVELTSFHARTDGSSVLLDWHTASELENKGFEIQRSTDDRNWGILGFVPGNGTTLEEQSYSFTDKFPLTGTNYYRLRQVDHDGKFEHSKVVAIELTGLEDVRVFPNPVSQGELTLYFPIDLDETYAMLRLYSPTAQLLRKQPIATREAKLDMTGLPAGVYVVELVSGRKAWRERVLVQ